MLSNLIPRVQLLFHDPTTFLERARAKFKSTILRPDKHVKQFVRHNQNAWCDWKFEDVSPTILFDYFPIAETEMARSYLLNTLAKKHRAKIISYSTYKVDNRVWDEIYKSFNVAGHIVVKLSRKQKDKCDLIFEEFLPRIKTRKDLFDLNLLGVWIGVDIYEEFLMRYLEPTVIIGDYRLKHLIREGIEALVFWKEYFEKHEVKAFVSSHIGLRLDKGLPVKIAGQLFGISFYSTHARSMTCYPEPHLYHSEVEKYYLTYHERFNCLTISEQKKGLSWAEERLQKRLSGTIGVDMAYSTKSAFTSDVSSKKVITKNNRIKILVATHEFYDSPNCYGGLLFLDFYEWLMFLGEISEKTNYDWYFKTHPDVLPVSKKIIQKIVGEHSHFQLVPPETSFHQLAEEGIEYVLTCYGSVGHECPLLGMKVINAGNNPHMGYDFNWNPKTVEEYEKLLMNLDSLKNNINPNDIYEFYYMHNKKTGVIDDWIYPSYYKMLTDLTEKERYGSAIFPYFLDSLSTEKHQQIISRMSNFIDSGVSGSPEV